MPTEISGSTGVNKVQDNTIVNADINSSAAIAGSKLVMPTGSVLQVVSANITSEVGTTSTSWVASPMAATITPSSTSSKIYISYNGFAYHYINEQAASTIYRGSTELSGKDGGFMRSWKSNSRGFFPHIANYLDSPNTTSATTYTVYVKKQSGSNAMDFPSSSSTTVPTITLMEIAG